jgi:hypothetical protein
MHIRLHATGSGDAFALPASLLVYIVSGKTVQIYVGERCLGACRETAEQIEELLNLARQAEMENDSAAVIGLKELAQWGEG